MLNRLISLFAGKQHNPAAVALYKCIVEQARQPDFYTHHGVPDSLDGRFDMIVLHTFLVMRRLRTIASQAAGQLSQDLFDLLFADMDSNLREIGVGDLGVGKRVKKMAQAFYGRVEAYEAGLTATGLSPSGNLVEIIEIPNHPWFLAVQFHPEFKSKPHQPHPLFAGFVEAALVRQADRGRAMV